MADTIHVLTFGVSLCQDPSGLPYQWPKGHRWVRAEDFAGVPAEHKCSRCKDKMATDSERLISAARKGRRLLSRSDIKVGGK